MRAELTKDKKNFISKKKEITTQILKPVEEFEATFKECITDVFDNADKQLKDRVDTVENAIKEKTRVEVREYFNEYLSTKKEIDFITYETAAINVTLSASKKNLKEQAKAFIERIADDLVLIDTQEHKDEILVEYKKSLNVSQAITMVVNRYKELEAIRLKATEKQTEVKVEVKPVVSAFEAPKKVVEEDTKVYQATFVVRGTKNKLKSLKEYLEINKYDFNT